MRRAVFLDRDGVLNRALVRDGRPFAPTSLEQFEILPDAAETARLLRDAGFLLIVATNQPDAGNGLVTREIIEQMHDRLRKAVPLDDILVCYDARDGQSSRRKPRPGMLLEAAARWNIDLPRSFMVGDRWKDVEAGRAAGCRTVFIQRGYREGHPVRPDYTVPSFREAGRIILEVADSSAAPIRSHENAR